MNKQDYIFVAKTDINEGFSSGTITKAALLCTKKYLFAIPIDSISVLGTTATLSSNSVELIDDVVSQLDNISLEACEQMLLDKLDSKRVYDVKSLEKFSVQVGFWLFGGMRLKKAGGSLEAINVQPKAIRAEIKAFYSL
jgi:hypothetical protein